MRLKFYLSIEYISSLLQLLYCLSPFIMPLVFAELVVGIKSVDSPCGNTHLNTSKGIIRSPNYPSSYPHEIKCEWKIHSPERSILRLRLVDLDIEEDRPCQKPPCCLHQWLLIPSQEGEPKLLCGSNSTKKTVMISQPVTVIKYFSSKPKAAGRGFEISYVITRRCKPQELECINGNCVTNNSFCNGINDCGDNSDEIYCPHLMRTPRKYDEFFPRHIIPEINDPLVDVCVGGRVICPLSKNRCYMPHLDVCDGEFDCPKGEDEVGCAPGCPNQIACSSGNGCYFPLQRCNFIRNCRDNSDETGCPTDPCIPLQFTCLNGACVPGSAICNGDDDCGDFSDEENCNKSSFMTAAVMGLMSCVFLFCIGLSCLYRVYAARLRASAGFAHQLDPEPMDDEFMYREPPPAYSVAVGDTGIIPYSASDFTERYFEVDPQQARIAGHNRRRNRSVGSGGGNSEQTSTPRSRPRPSGALSSNISQFPEIQNQPKAPDFCSKCEPTGDRSDFSGVMELLGFSVETNHPQLCPHHNAEQTITNQSARFNESPYSSPSLSPSRESVTSSTSLDEHEDLVRSCRS